MRSLITRFAPSPTGYLHLGHLLSACYVWGIARWLKAQIILRIEDHDFSRTRTQYIEAIFRDLSWLGFEADLGPSSPDAMSPYRQCYRINRYQALLDKLIGQQLVYRCYCSRKDLSLRQNKRQDSHAEIPYDQFCRHHPHQARNALAFSWRIKVDSLTAPITFHDAINGPQHQTLHQQCGDFVLQDRNKHYSYQFAVVCDDHDQKINLVIRGADLLASTGRQIFLHQSLFQTAPNVIWAHHPLIYDSVTQQKLSKALRSTALATLRNDHQKPSQLIGQVLYQAQVIPREQSVHITDLADIMARQYEQGFSQIIDFT